MHTMSNRQRILLLITLFFSGVLIMSESIMTPTINMLYTLFSNGIGYINFAVTGCYIFSIATALIAGKMCEKFSKKTLLIFGGIVGTIGGLGMVFLIQPVFLAIMRSLLMISYGFTSTVGIVVISELYGDGVKRGKVLGYYNAVSMGIGGLLSLASGYLATISLQTAYNLHILIGLYLVMLFIFVPSMKKPDRSEQINEEEKIDLKKERMGKTYWIVLINYVFYTFAYCTILYFVSVYVIENNLGNEATVGVVGTMRALIGFCSSFMFGFVFRKLGKNIIIVPYVLAIVACLLLWLYPAIWCVFFAFGLFGIATSLLRVFHYAACPALAPEKRSGSAVAYIEALTLLAVSVVAYVVTWTKGVAKMETQREFLIVPLIIMAANLVVGVIISRSKKMNDIKK